MKSIVNKTKTIFSGIIVIFFLSFGIYYLTVQYNVEAVVFLALSAAFGYVFYLSASVVTIDHERVSVSFLGRPRRSLAWSEIQEVGLIGEGIYSRSRTSGHKYIYFSPVTMTQPERIKMIRNWPPKEQLYVEYRENTLAYATAVWGKELKTFNVKDLFPDSEEPKKEEKEV